MTSFFPPDIRLSSLKKKGERREEEVEYVGQCVHPNSSSICLEMNSRNQFISKFVNMMRLHLKMIVEMV